MVVHIGNFCMVILWMFLNKTFEKAQTKFTEHMTSTDKNAHPALLVIT